MNWNNLKIKKGVKIALFSLVFVLSIGFVEKRRQEKICTAIDIRIDNHFDNYFIDQNDVMNLITENGTVNITGVALDELPLKEIEKRIERHHFVHNAEVYKNLYGSVVVNAYQSVPLARVVQDDGPDAYVSEEGRVLPVSEKFTARVMVIGGAFTRELVKQDLTADSTTMEVYNLLQYIDQDAFWRAQIAQLDIDMKGNITFFPQVGKQLIEFGRAENIEQKFKKLKLFYEQILPQKGWNTYERVNLKFNNQIICE